MGGEVARNGRATYADPYFFQFADRSAADHFHGTPEFAAVFGSLLAAGLKNDLVFLDCIGHGSAFAYGQGNRFLTINVFLGPGRQDRGFSMPVVRRRDEHGVDLFVGQKLSVVGCDVQSLPILARGVLAIVLFDQSLGMLGANLGNFSKARDLGPWVANQFMGVTPAHFARSDDHGVDPVVGGSVSFGRPYVGGEDEGGGTEGGLLEEISAVGHEEFLTEG